MRYCDSDSVKHQQVASSLNNTGSFPVVIVGNGEFYICITEKNKVESRPWFSFECSANVSEDKRQNRLPCRSSEGRVPAQACLTAITVSMCWDSSAATSIQCIPFNYFRIRFLSTMENICRLWQKRLGVSASICCLWLMLSNRKSYCDKELIYGLWACGISYSKGEIKNWTIETDWSNFLGYNVKEMLLFWLHCS